MRPVRRAMLNDVSSPMQTKAHHAIPWEHMMSISEIDPEWFQQVEKANEFVTLMDADDRLLYVNHPQPGVEDYVGRPVLDFVAAEFHQTLRRAVDGARETGLPQHFVSHAAGPDGETSHYSNWVLPLSGRIARGVVAFVATDVTHQGRIEEELELSETALRSLVDNSPDAILIVDRNRKIVFINRFEFGFAIEDTIGQPAESFVPEPYRQTVIDAVAHVLATGEPTSYDTELVTPQGARHYTTRLAPIPRDGEIDRIMMVATDITERYEAQQERQQLAAQLQHAQKMDAMGQLTGGVAHDFNNLLTAISGNLELAQTNDGDPTSVGEYIAEALEAVHRASTLTQRLLAFSRKQDLRPCAVDANDLVLGMRSLMQRTLGETIEVRTETAGGLWSCHVDAAQLENAILNLAVNARDAMPEGGLLTISNSNFTSDGGSGTPVPPGDFVRIVVKDNGTGMTPEVATQSIEPFFTTKDVGEGSGLGLSMVHGFVHQSGGYVQIMSEPGSGTSVEIYLPGYREPAMPRPQSTTVEEVPRGNDERVLVVEDDSQVRELTAEMLRGLGYRVELAADAKDALKCLDAGPDIALLLSDVVLPGGTNGFELADLARRIVPDLPVLFVSGYPQDALQRVAHNEWAEVVLHKPYTIAQIARALRGALEGQQGS